MIGFPNMAPALPQPRWEVTWPIRPSGTHTVLVRAADPTDAVRVAAELELPLGGGLTMAFDYEPCVWLLRHPYSWRAQHAQGPEYPDGFAPVTVEPVWPEGVIARYLTVVGAHVEITGGYGTAYRRCTGCGDGEGWGGWSEARARELAQAHAETCRALPKPEVK